VKLQATKLLLENTENSFVTPVFNGSASLRNAAGHLIESVTKSMRRKEKMDDAYLQKLYQSTTALYRLEGGNGTTVEDGLPAVSVGLLATLGVIWTGIAVYYVVSYAKKRKNPR
jgi:multiple sugar transport system substrate-binding protein